MDELTASVIQVGDGRGFIVESQDAINQWIITAAHCLPYLPPAHPRSYTEERTYENLLGPLDGERRVWAECVFADPVADIAVLTGHDDQELSDKAAAFVELILKPSKAFRVKAPSKTRLRVWLLTPANVWTSCQAELVCESLSIRGANQGIVGGMSGSPILDDEGDAIGLVPTSGGAPDTVHTAADFVPCLSEALPGWLLRRLGVCINPSDTRPISN